MNGPLLSCRCIPSQTLLVPCPLISIIYAHAPNRHYCMLPPPSSPTFLIGDPGIFLGFVFQPSGARSEPGTTIVSIQSFFAHFIIHFASFLLHFASFMLLYASFVVPCATSVIPCPLRHSRARGNPGSLPFLFSGCRIRVRHDGWGSDGSSRTTQGLVSSRPPADTKHSHTSRSTRHTRL